MPWGISRDEARNLLSRPRRAERAPGSLTCAYRHALLRPPGRAPAASLTVLLGRIPIGIFSLAIVLLVRQQTGSFAQAGAASAAWAIGAGDRRAAAGPPRRPLRPAGGADPLDAAQRGGGRRASSLARATPARATWVLARAARPSAAPRCRRSAACMRSHVGDAVRRRRRARATPPTRSRAWSRSCSSSSARRSRRCSSRSARRARRCSSAVGAQPARDARLRDGARSRATGAASTTRARAPARSPRRGCAR